MKNGRTSQERLRRQLEARVRKKDVRKQLEHESRRWFEWVHDFAGSHESDFAGRFRTWIDAHWETFHEILGLDLFYRLHGLHQWGVKHYLCAREDEPWNPGNLWKSLPLAHTRWMHSVQVSAKAAVLGLQTRCQPRDILHLAVAGLCHDLGHPAGSHDADLLMMREGLVGHEARSLQLVADSPDLQRILGANGVQAVLGIMAEEGPLGHIQSLADTWAYAGGHDMRMVHIGRKHRLNKRLESIFTTIDRDLCTVVWKVDDRGLSVARTEPFEQLLEFRMWLSSRYYHSLPNMIAQVAFQKLLLLAREAEVFALKELATMTSPELYARFASFAQSSTDLSPQVRSMIRIVFGDVSALEEWLPVPVSEEEAGNVPALSMLVRPRTHGRKTVPVIYQGRRVELAADPLKGDRQTYLYTYRG